MDTSSAIGNLSETEFLETYRNSTDTFRDITRYVNIYLTPVIIAIGVPTNVISFIIFMHSSMRKQSSNVYLASMALADGGFLLTVLVNWLSWVDIHVVHKNGMCQMIIYMGSVCSFLSVWNVASFTVERFIAVVFPFHHLRWCSVRLATGIVVGEAILALILYSFPLWTNHVGNFAGHQVCSIKPGMMR